MKQLSKLSLQIQLTEKNTSAQAEENFGGVAHLLNSMVHNEKPYKEGYYTMQDVSNDSDNAHF